MLLWNSLAIMYVLDPTSNLIFPCCNCYCYSSYSDVFSNLVSGYVCIYGVCSTHIERETRESQKSVT